MLLTLSKVNLCISLLKRMFIFTSLPFVLALASKMLCTFVRNVKMFLGFPVQKAKKKQGAS